MLGLSKSGLYLVGLSDKENKSVGFKLSQYMKIQNRYVKFLNVDTRIELVVVVVVAYL